MVLVEIGTLAYLGAAVPLFGAWVGLYAVTAPLAAALRAASRVALNDDIVIFESGRYATFRPGAFLSYAVGLLELPCCLLSYAYYCAMQRAVLPLAAKLKRNQSSTRWVDALHEKLGGEVVDAKVILGALLFGPRWNTHTNVHSIVVEPGAGNRTPVLEIENLKTEGLSWQVVAYGNHMSRETLNQCGRRNGEGDRISFPVVTKAPFPTTFSLAIRVYLFGPATSAALPRIWQDGRLLTTDAPTVFTKERLAFNFRLRKHQRLHHLALHYYVFPLLYFRDLFTEYFVRWQYLPVGNPETQWLYGPVLAGYALKFDVDADALEDHLVFCTVYSRASMPTLPCNEIGTSPKTLDTSDEDGYFAMRCVRKDGATTERSVLDKITVHLVKGAGTKAA